MDIGFVKGNYSKYFVICLFALVVVASGCTDSSTSPSDAETGDSPQQTDEAASDESSGDSGDSSEPAEISLTSFNVPEEVEMGENFTVEASFENTGGQSGEFETTVMMREQDVESFSVTESTIKGEIPAGEQRTFEKTLTANSVSSNVIGLAGTDAESSLRIVPKRIGVGQEYTTSNSIGITVQSVDLEDYYRYEDIYGEESIQEPESGQYVFVNLKTQNQGDVPKTLPSSYDFQMIANNRQYEPATALYNEPIDKGESYEGGEVQPGIIREGYFVFEVPEDVNEDDISVVWNEMISLSEKSVYWTT
jgi:hypothetical protein